MCVFVDLLSPYVARLPHWFIPPSLELAVVRNMQICNDAQEFKDWILKIGQGIFSAEQNILPSEDRNSSTMFSFC